MGLINEKKNRVRKSRDTAPFKNRIFKNFTENSPFYNLPKIAEMKNDI